MLVADFIKEVIFISITCLSEIISYNLAKNRAFVKSRFEKAVASIRSCITAEN
jgi:hypothetical protein